MPTISLVVNKRLQFRGQQEDYSNRYLFQAGANPITTDFVSNLYDAIRNMERGLHTPAVTFTGGWGGPVDLPAVFSKTEAPGMTGTGGTTNSTHPETCVMAESKIQNRVYLRKFYHLSAGQASGSGDTVLATLVTSVNTALVKLTDGTLPGGVIACRPNGALATVPFTSDPYLRTRQFKRRGRRPTPSG